MKLLHKDGATTVVRSADGLDITDSLRGAYLQIARNVLDQGILGAVVKSGSPSCAAGGTPLFSEQDGSLRVDGVGLFVQALRGLAPDLPVIDEIAFEDDGRREAFFLLMGA